MRVILWMIDGDKIPGGHVIQAQKTAETLQRLGVEAVLSYEPGIDLTGVDLVHGFGLPIQALRLCRQKRVPVVLSTIYCSLTYREGRDQKGRSSEQVPNRLRKVAKAVYHGLSGDFEQFCRESVEIWRGDTVRFEMAEMLLPNSVLEATRIKDELNVSTPMHVVPNAVDHKVFFSKPSPSETRRGILYVGRIEPHKNQLGLIKALANSEYELTMVGEPHPHHINYYRQCKKNLGKRQRILDGVAHHDLPAFYRAAKVHVLPSWFETTGLVSLEAALCGCNIVTTERGYAKEYFQGLASYCNPGSGYSIRESIDRAYASPTSPALRDRIMGNYTWVQTGHETLRAYQAVLNMRQL